MRTLTIAIIGGGFSGCVLAANLLRQPPPRSTRILLFERRSCLGHGVAYQRSDFPYLLNVPAARMSAASRDGEQLIRYARRFLPQANAGSYLPRALYGEYLREFLRLAVKSAPPQVQFEHVRGEVIAVGQMRALPADSSIWIQNRLAAGESRRYAADILVLACGEPTAPIKSYARAVAGHPAYVRDPHCGVTLLPSDRHVLLIGTGLTMVDMAVAAAARNAQLQLLAVSRHGLLPAAQPSGHHPVVLDPQLNLSEQLRGRSTRELMAAVRALAGSVQRQGGDWREIVTRMRECVPALWHRMSEQEQRRFLRHVRAYWDVHRHRMPPEFAARLQALQRAGRLKIAAGRIQVLRPAGARIAVEWRSRGGSESQRSAFDRVIDCSSSEQRLRDTPDRLWRRLLETGMIAPDAAGIGLRTGAHGAVIDAAGRSLGRIFYLGPMLRAAHWEATAVGELRMRAEALAATLAHSSHQSKHDGVPIDSLRAVV